MNSRLGIVAKATRFAACVAAVIATAGQLQAGLFYSAPPSSAGFGWASNSITGYQRLVQDFSLETGGTVDKISFFGFHQSSTPSIGSSFVLEFFADLVGSPSASSFYSHTTDVVAGVDTGINNNFGLDIFRWDFSVPGVQLSASTQYWFGVKSNSPDNWVWSNSALDGSYDGWFRYNDTNTFTKFLVQTGDNQAMEFAGFTGANAVPEPGSLAIFGIGALGLGVVGIRRRKKQTA